MKKYIDMIYPRFYASFRTYYIIIILLGAVVSLHLNSCYAEIKRSTPAQAYASLQEAVKNKNYEEIAGLIFPPSEIVSDQNLLTREKYAASLRKEAENDPEKYEQEMSFGGILYSGNIRNIDIKEKTEDISQIARIFVEGTVSIPTSEGVKEVPSLALFQAYEYQNQWYFFFIGGEDIYYGIVPKPEFSTPQLAYRTIRNAQRMLDWYTLYHGLAPAIRKEISEEQYRNFVLMEKHPSYQDFISLNTVEGGDESSTKEIIEELGPVGTLPQVKVKRASRGIEYYQDGYSEWESENFVKEGKYWKWMPSQKSAWIPEEVYSTILTEQDRKKQNNEKEAIISLRKISVACEAFRAAQNPPSYPSDLDVLTNAYPPYIDNQLVNEEKSGYKFTYTRIAANQYNCIASPKEPGVSGDRTFFIDESGVIRLNDANGDPIE